MPVRRIVVADQMKLLVLWRFPINLTRKGEPFLMPVSRLAIGNRGAIVGIERREQRRGAMTLVVVRRARAPAWLHR